ncbi:MAG: aspartate ammonia-lyase [Nanoarchaeota archaeon]|nr:aspartate ammonia-lyase [Nanoarchaeota archaeon]MBU0977875.1 aspartate ammonia-lyase [Nanoarchaeota archaeon]
MKSLIELDKNQRGCAGEYLVCGEMNKRGIIASLTIKNTKGIDILGTNADASKSVGIQVKSTIHERKSYPHWVLGEKSETYHSDTLFYVFVLLKEGTERPDFYIVPSKEVANHTKTTHDSWMEKGRAKGIEHNSKMRIFYDKDKKWLEKWNLLGL